MMASGEQDVIGAPVGGDEPGQAPQSSWRSAPASFTGEAEDWARSGEWQLCDSSAISHIRYVRSSLSLGVLFLESGALYVYHGVLPTIAKAMFDSPSKGVFYNGWIKGQYPYTGPL